VNKEKYIITFAEEKNVWNNFVRNKRRAGNMIRRHQVGIISINEELAILLFMQNESYLEEIEEKYEKMSPGHWFLKQTRI
jgi:hypothetical protein